MLSPPTTNPSLELEMGPLSSTVPHIKVSLQPEGEAGRGAWEFWRPLPGIFCW